MSFLLLPLLLLSVGNAQEMSPPTKPLPSTASCAEIIAAFRALAPTREQEPNGDKQLKQHLLAIAERASADQLNHHGMRCYKEQRLNDAGWLFGLALAQDPEHVLANYNLACVIGLQMATVGPCDTYSGWGAPFALLRQAIKGDPSRLQRVREDKDLDAYRAWPGMRMITMGMPTTAAELAAFVDGMMLWGDTPGVAMLAEVSFKRTHANALTGTVSGWRRNVDLEQIQVNGTWRAEGTSLIVDWSPGKLGGNRGEPLV
jgi:hypothetical protein